MRRFAAVLAAVSCVSPLPAFGQASTGTPLACERLTSVKVADTRITRAQLVTKPTRYPLPGWSGGGRSEEHTSELQSPI